MALAIIGDLAEHPAAYIQIQATRALMLPSLLHVFEEDPLVEAAAFNTLTARLRHNLLPAHVMDRGEGLEYFQNVS
jgi:hypothetical protein